MRPPNISNRKLSSIVTSNFECRTAHADGETALCAVPLFHHVLYWVTSPLHIDPRACPEELASKQFFFFLLFHIKLMSSAVCIFLLSVSEIQLLMWHCTAKFLPVVWSTWSSRPITNLHHTWRFETLIFLSFWCLRSVIPVTLCDAQNAKGLV